MNRTSVVVGSVLLPTMLALPSVSDAGEARPEQPNVLVILADDLGYADLGCQGSKEVISPHIDSIAANGVRCTAGYVTAPQCGPSRAGLITGRYQNRFGFEANWPASLAGKAGLPPGEATIADRLKAAGYATGVVGKWHLGHLDSMRPSKRGFEESLWHPNGGVLFPDAKKGTTTFYRGDKPVEVAGYSTDVFGREASEFIRRHRAGPWFLYLAFVPPHWPMEAKPEHLAQFSHIRDRHRRTMLAMMASLDENIGRVLATLRETGAEQKTLVFFLSDNGGPTGRARPNPDADFEYGQNTSLNLPCRGVKGDLLEGGIRIPFLVQWKGRIPAGKTCDRPVISLDILPTALAAAGVTARPDWKIDGANLLPLLTGESTAAPHDTLCWRFRFPPNQPARHRWAIRQGDWKLVKNDTEPLSLYDLAADVGETRNLAIEQADRVRAMKAAWERWNAEMKDPLWRDPPPIVRGRHDATVLVAATEIQIRSTGNDPQAVFGDIPAAKGPFTLEMKIKSASSGRGEVFWSTTGKPQFVAGQSVGFEPRHDGQWHDYRVKLPADGSIRFVRLDPSAGPGLVRIARLAIKDADDKIVKTWMPQPAPTGSKSNKTPPASRAIR